MKTYYTIFEKSNSMKADAIPPNAYKHSRCYDALYPTEQSAQHIIDTYCTQFPHTYYVGEVLVREA